MSLEQWLFRKEQPLILHSTVVGQVGFGILADIVGRKKMYGLELILIIFATVAQALTAAGPGLSIVGTIVFWRVLMGIGMIYPLKIDHWTWLTTA